MPRTPGWRRGGSIVLGSTPAVGCTGTVGGIDGGSERCAFDVNGAVGSSDDDDCRVIGFGSCGSTVRFASNIIALRSR